VSVHFSEVVTPPEFRRVSAMGTRVQLTEWLRDLMVRQQFETEMAFGPETLPAAIAETARRRPGQVILEDATMHPLSYRRLAVGAELLAGEWLGLPGQDESRIGVLLPNVTALPVVLVSLWLAGKVPTVLNYSNYSSGAATLLRCAQLAGLKRVITSKTVLERLHFDAASFQAAGIELLFLEDMRRRISRLRKAGVFLRTFIRQPLSLRRRQLPGPEDSAVVMFTSGSEGEPKGVELSHRNLLANIRQMLAVVDLTEADRFFNALPLFHSFGLTIGLLLPLVRGLFTFLYLSPLQYRVVPSAFYNLDCTIFFGTNTFLAGYGRKAHPYDFRRLRYVFAGAEKLQETTAALWMSKFGVRILEGYGATECSPCLAANLPMRPRHGSVGRLLPGLEYKLEAVEGIEDGAAPAGPKAGLRDGSGVGRLWVRGPNIMRGYVNPEPNARFQALGGWYDTGDIVRVDGEGFLHILGRLKRFAKVSGEMVSLTAVEEALAAAFPQYGPRFAIAVTTLLDERKGEKLVAVTNETKLSLEQVREALRARGLGNLAIPREIKLMRELPRLGTGKVDYRRLEKELAA
jgi:acyl-[acyl-carrier-protein]-phospholipid O-acyltransferase/long-chain-fatty-acid--[acyl-carrier-protein] ligase